jgi:hypothetical protein
LIIKVDWFKPTGKWYAGGLIDIGEARLHLGNVLEAIDKNQEILTPGSGRHFIIVTDNVEDAAGNDQSFCKALYGIRGNLE